MIDLVNHLYEDKDVLIGAYCADMHFGALNPATQYSILKEQFVDVIRDLPLDLVAIPGDLFDHKAMANSDLVMYTLLFVEYLVSEVIRPKGITLIVVSGTAGHDAKQLKLLYKYLQDPTVDVRIVESIGFEFVKGHKILCIPELASIDEAVYEKYLFRSGYYNQVIMHGTIEGAVPMNEVGNCRLFHIEDFVNCTGPIISGHVHEPGCFNGYFYYTGSPYSWSFADHDNKGFLIVLSNKVTRMHYTCSKRIESFRYITINLDDFVCYEADTIISYINSIQEEQGIDYIRVQFSKEVPTNTKKLVDMYYKDNDNVKLQYSFTKAQKELEEKLSSVDEFQQYSYIYDKSLSEYEILAKYINDDKGYVFVTADQIKKFVEEEF